jgi:hypothetical protein
MERIFYTTMTCCPSEAAALTRVASCHICATRCALCHTPGSPSPPGAYVCQNDTQTQRLNQDCPRSQARETGKYMGVEDGRLATTSEV